MAKSTQNINCNQCTSRGNSLFKGFSHEDSSKLSALKSCNYYGKNQPLFIEGSIPRGVYCINKGKVKVFKRGDEGKEQIIKIGSNGDIIGFKALFSGEPFIVSATTIEESNICFIGKADFLNMLDHNNDLRNELLKELSKELASRASFITNMAQKTVRERLASILLILGDIYKNEYINISREDLSNYTGTATETLIRFLKEFKEEKIILTHSRKIEILDQKKLFEIAS